MSDITIPVGMKVWAGGDEAPDDWDGGPVVCADGHAEHPDDITRQQWKSPIPGCKWNIVGYTSTLISSPSLELCVQFSDDGQRIRKWSRLPFDGCERLYSHAAPNSLVDFIRMVANLSGDELDAHASPELRDMALAVLRRTSETDQLGAAA